MIRRLITIAGAALLLAACETSQMESRSYFPTATPIDGSWTSTDGAFVVTYKDGTFTTRSIRTSSILARGGYGMVGEKVRMRWVSPATGKTLIATCSFSEPNAARCLQSGVGGFNIRRLTGGGALPPDPALPSDPAAET